MSRVKALARQFRKQYLSGDPTVATIKKALQQQGYTVVMFSSAGNDPATQSIIDALQLHEHILTGRGFTYADHSWRLVFLHEGLSEAEASMVLLHEQGHISCGHMGSRAVIGQDVVQENEASEFAHYLLHPGLFTQFHRWVARHKKGLLITLAAVLGITLTIGIFFAVHNSQTFYLTRTGSKYHTKHCIHTEGKDDLTAMSLGQLEKEGYEPCELCLPER